MAVGVLVCSEDAVVTVCTSIICPLTDLVAGHTWEVTAVATKPDGTRTPASAVVEFVTPAEGVPVLLASATSPTVVEVTVMRQKGPGFTGPYTITATPNSAAKVVAISCEAATCELGRLKPATEYVLTVTGILSASGKPTLPSEPVYVATPAIGCVYAWSVGVLLAADL